MLDFGVASSRMLLRPDDWLRERAGRCGQEVDRGGSRALSGGSTAGCGTCSHIAHSISRLAAARLQLHCTFLIRTSPRMLECQSRDDVLNALGL